MQKRVHSGTYYVTLAMFEADFDLMKRNCEVYNTPDTVYCKLMWRLHAYFRSYLDSHTAEPAAVVD
jgi:histone acetyltransferase